MPLTKTKVETAKPLQKPYKLTDERGLFLLVSPNSGKYWRFKYYFDGKEKLLSFGIYPDVSLADARAKRDDARKLVANHVDPHVVKQAQKMANSVSANTFEAIAREWFMKFSLAWVSGYSNKVIRRLESFVFPWLKGKVITDITPVELLMVLRRIEVKGALDTARRVRQYCGQIFRYAMATGRAERDPSQDLQGAIPRPKVKHYASLVEQKAIGQLLRTMDGYEGSVIVRAALQLAPLFFVRPGELRQAEWSEIDFDTAEWRITAEKMKMRSPHIVPLARQALVILKDLQPLTGHGRYLFSSLRGASRPMSENTVNAAGYSKEQITGHGFRSMASTLLNEQGWNRDAIERQLAHSEHNSIRAAYNYAEYLPERRKMMQHWADFLDQLKQNI